MANRVFNFFYNIDRAIASLFGAPPQATISAEIEKHEQNPVAEAAEDVLNKLQSNHAELAEDRATRLEAADTGKE